MAKKKKQKVAEKATKAKNVTEDTVTKVNLDTPVDTAEENNVIKVNLDKPIEAKEEVVEEAPVTEEVTEVVEEVPVVAEALEDTPVVEEITGEEITEEIIEDIVNESIETGEELPENIQKLVDFMGETGGDMNDYIALNRDYKELDNQTLLKEYYKSTKPHLSEDEIDFVMEDTFSYDEDLDEDNDIKRKKLAMKEQVASARQHLESVKSKYYEEIKAGSKLTEEQQNAITFFNKHNEESERDLKIGKNQSDVFTLKTNKVFNENFKGFEYNVGDKKFRVNVKDRDKVKQTQGDINNFIKKFLTEDNLIDDAKGYHKGLFTAMNPDAIANHFYEQGKTDAIRDSIAKSKNVSMDPRQSHLENINTSGFKARVVSNDRPDFEFKIKPKK